MAVTGIVLAAGSASRMGRPKQLLPLDGLPLVVHVIRQARSAGLDRVRVVVGSHADEVASAVADEPVEIFVNEAFEDGSFSSLRTGLEGLSGTAVLLVADMPQVDPEAIRRVAKALESGAWGIVTEYEDDLGHPFGLSSDLIAELPDAAPHRHLYDLLAGSTRTQRVVVAGPKPTDINTPSDYRRAGGEATI